MAFEIGFKHSISNTITVWAKQIVSPSCAYECPITCLQLLDEIRNSLSNSQICCVLDVSYSSRKVTLVPSHVILPFNRGLLELRLNVIGSWSYRSILQIYILNQHYQSEKKSKLSEIISGSKCFGIVNIVTSSQHQYGVQCYRYRMWDLPIHRTSSPLLVLQVISSWVRYIRGQ